MENPVNPVLHTPPHKQTNGAACGCCMAQPSPSQEPQIIGLEVRHLPESAWGISGGPENFEVTYPDAGINESTEPSELDVEHSFLPQAAGETVTYRPDWKPYEHAAWLPSFAKAPTETPSRTVHEPPMQLRWRRGILQYARHWTSESGQVGGVDWINVPKVDPQTEEEVKESADQMFPAPMPTMRGDSYLAHLFPIARAYAMGEIGALEMEQGFRRVLGDLADASANGSAMAQPSEQPKAADAGIRMSKWVPTTNPMEVRRLGKTMEETGELIAVLARCLIQGINETDPSSGKVNRQRLEEETADVRAQLQCTVRHYGLDRSGMARRQDRKVDQMAEWESLFQPAPASLKTPGFGEGFDASVDSAAAHSNNARTREAQPSQSHGAGLLGARPYSDAASMLRLADKAQSAAERVCGASWQDHQRASGYAMAQPSVMCEHGTRGCPSPMSCRQAGRCIDRFDDLGEGKQS